MISPDVARAVPRLEQDGILNRDQARLFGRVARGELVSLSGAIHILLYLGVVAVTTGAGLLFKEQIANLGPIAISLGIGLVVALCLAWVSRRSARYSPGEVASPHFAFDYVLLLAALLFAADLAFLETQLRPLGNLWAFHLLLVAAGYAALAFRFDSRTLFGLSLTTFAAWRGVAATSVERSLFGFFNDTDAVRVNAFACGILFIALGGWLVRRRVKAHFEPTATNLGWLLVLQAIAWGMGDAEHPGAYRALLMITGSALAIRSWQRERFTLFVFGMLAAYLGFMVTLAVVLDGVLLLFLIAVSAIGLAVSLGALHRHFAREETE